MTADDLKRMGIIDEIVEEPVGGAHKDPAVAATLLKNYIEHQLDLLETIDTNELLENRYERFRKYGSFVE